MKKIFIHGALGIIFTLSLLSACSSEIVLPEISDKTGESDDKNMEDSENGEGENPLTFPDPDYLRDGEPDQTQTGIQVGNIAGNFTLKTCNISQFDEKRHRSYTRT